MHMDGQTTQPLAVPFKDEINTQYSYTIQVKVIYSATENAPVGGLYFSSTGKDGGIFIIDPKNKRFAVQDNNWSSLTWQDNDTEVFDEKGVNTLKVVSYGTQVRFYINDRVVKEKSDFVHRGGQVGLYFYSLQKATLTYDDFILRGIKHSTN